MMIKKKKNQRSWKIRVEKLYPCRFHAVRSENVRNAMADRLMNIERRRGILEDARRSWIENFEQR